MGPIIYHITKLDRIWSLLSVMFPVDILQGWSTGCTGKTRNLSPRSTSGPVYQVDILGTLVDRIHMDLKDRNLAGRFPVWNSAMHPVDIL